MEKIANRENQQKADKIVYVLSEEDLAYDCGNEPWFGVLGVFGNLEDAKEAMMKELEAHKSNFDMFESRENKTNDMRKLLFYEEYGNLEHYTEFEIEEYIVE